MVITKPAAIPTVPSEVRLNSNRTLRYVAPFPTENSTSDALFKRIRSSESQSDSENWEGIMEMCQAIDDIFEIDKDTELMADKSVLEIGFCTGLPSVFALDSGASEVTIHPWNPASLELFVKPTMRRNKAPKNRCKFNTSTFSSTIRSLGGKKFDVILAPELLYVDEADFEAIHDILDAALTPNGIVLICSRPYYANCSGNIPAFLELCKLKGTFDAHFKWTSSKTDPAPHKLIQLTRTIR
ncbi:unnamed protein product [Bursaphelenchus okinawaensis]|uniref:Uncharacterized protein n=1 Tax=Bursaphelenchus okinawaensis TaxID=465554 RepID=A0A811KK71_9BILA|nr:unnamed protein product [Bursaphelenchus okinawaensis]CAG9104574.1 unnamed protein product [Bursaphelenchus okinawaensis]